MIRVSCQTVGPFQENCYLIVDEGGARAVLVDPGEEPDRVLAMIDSAGATLDAVWLTHAHFDHIGALDAVRQAHPVPVYMHPLDRPVFKRASDDAATFGVALDQPALPDRDLAEGDRLRVGGAEFLVLHTPGHAPGHVAFLGAGLLLGGDLLFRGSIGRTDLPYCDADAMDLSLARVRDLPAATRVLPGHGPSTTIGVERIENPFLNGTALPVRS